MDEVEIIPSVLTSDINEAHDLIAKAEGKVKRVQIDIVDGKFADNKTLLPEDFSEIETKLLIDYHLMVDNPVDWLFKCKQKVGDRVIAQIEKMPNVFEFFDVAEELGFGVGLALDLQTLDLELTEDLWKRVNVILLMSVKAGIGGQTFDQSVYLKIKGIDKLRKEKGFSFKVCVDGGVVDEIIPKLSDLGVNEVVMGRRWYKEHE